MKLSVRAVALTGALIWGVLCMFLVGLGNMMWTDYGKGLLDLAASLYPGYNATPSIGQVLIGTLYGLLDGAICGALFAWLYNSFAGGASRAQAPA